MKRPQLDYQSLAPLDPERPELPEVIGRNVNIMIKYAGYIAMEEERVRQFRKMESRLIPPSLDYTEVRGLRLEAIQKLNAIRPESLGQAGRISGVSPADLTVLLVYLEQKTKEGADA
jgi:tRNA uridine 5-carboxymethylaminomethyl modification enzyme